MDTASARRSLWIALGGLLLGILGVGWDRLWHSRHAGGQLSGASELLEAHWLMILGVVITLVALVTAVRSVRRPRSAVVGTWIALVGSVLMVVGFGWDSGRHIQGTESPTAHAMIYAGLLSVVIGLPAALAFWRDPIARPGAKGTD